MGLTRVAPYLPPSQEVSLPVGPSAIVVVLRRRAGRDRSLANSQRDTLSWLALKPRKVTGLARRPQAKCLRSDLLAVGDLAISEAAAARRSELPKARDPSDLADRAQRRDPQPPSV